ncbi:nucleotidyltransferase family protein [Denitrobaculum tricleocarpae]|uniref:Nucleotidyltransferase family protein n=1 Tax=Denitrobaculum tricleocarpae TaxID=2591009 RepID=A0A545TGE0_9PROT|nr:nucleotidyltransferase family protein [Denitrobaculum tricleocarpae]TQV76191.1 nucleotidyltransferase family protein [Denitrobaculum tricleocarpae]
MTTEIPKRAMVLAAGLGTRMKMLTENLPKPLVEVSGQAMLDTILDRVEAAGIQEVVINLHYLGEQIVAHLEGRPSPKILYSREEELLETGGGVKKALPLLGEDPFFVTNGDVCWLDGYASALERLAEQWNEGEMDGLLLLHPTVYAFGYDGVGDFHMDAAGRISRRKERGVAPFIYAGIQILHPRFFDDAPDGPFSLNLLYDRAIENERLFGIRHDGEWFHIGTPEQLRETEWALKELSFSSVQT